MMKKIIAILLLVAMTLTILPMNVFAGEKEDAVMESERNTYIRKLVGTEDSPEYRSGAKLSANMNAGQMETGLNELLSKEIGETLHELENIISFIQSDPSNTDPLENSSKEYDDVINLLGKLQTVWTEVKSCRDIISEDRAFVIAALEAFEKGDVYKTEHEKESAANQILQRSENLEKQITTAGSLYATWKQVINEAKKCLSSTSSNGPSNDLQTQIDKLKSSRVAEMKRIASREPKTAGKDIIIDVISIYEVRIYALDSLKKPLKDAVIYCWPVNESNPDRNKGVPRYPNEEGYVTIPTAELGADEDHYMTMGYEVVCPGYRTQYAEANYIKGGEGIWCSLEKNDPKEDVYVAGISLNGFDCKWYEKELYITDENTADQTVELFLRSQSGADFSGTAKMKYENRDPNKNDSKYTELSSDYKSTGGAASTTFKAKLCQEVAGGQKNAFTFTLSSSVANDEITPNLKSENAQISKTQYAQDDSILDALYFGQISLAWPKDVPFLNSMSMNFDAGSILGGHVYVLTNCSGLWAVIASTNQQPMTDKIKKLNDEWMTEDSKMIRELTDTEYNKYAGLTKQQIASGYKTLMYDCKVPGTYGGKKIYGSASIAFFGTYSKFAEMDFEALYGLQLGFRGDWTRQFFLAGAFPVNVGWGFDMSASVFIKFHFQGWEYTGGDITTTLKMLGYMSGGPGIRVKLFGKTFSAGLGFRFQLGLMMDIPIFTSRSEGLQDKIFTFNIGLSFYADFFFAHFVWNMWSGTGEWNITKNNFHFTSKPFWKNNNSSETLAAASGISLDDSKTANSTTIEEEIFSQDEINGDTRWPYQSYEFTKDAESVPTYFSLHWDAGEPYQSDCDYIFWVENGSSVKFTQTDLSGGYEESFGFPTDVQSQLDSGKWKITGVRAAAHPEVYNVHVRQGGTDSTMKVQLASVSVTIGTDWITETETIGGQQITKEVPTGSVVVTRLYLYNGLLSQLQYPVDDYTLKDVVFVNQTDGPVSDAIGMIFEVNLKGWQPKGTTQWTEDIVMDCKSRLSENTDLDENYLEEEEFWENEANGASLVNICTSDNSELPGMVYFLSELPSETIIDARLQGGGLPEEKPVKQLIGGSGYYGFIVALMEDGSIYYISSYRAHSSLISDVDSFGEMSDIALVRTGFVENDSADYTLFCSPKSPGTGEDGKVISLQSITLKPGYSYCDTEQFTDYDVDLNGAPIFAGHLLNESYLYWFEDFQDEQTGENRTAVKGMCYSPKYNMMTSPFRLGVLSGSDGDIPSGCSVTGAPVFSHVMSDGNMIITKPWLSDSDEEQTETRQILSSYKVNVTRRVYGELLGAGTEMPAVSAGRDCNMLFTVNNKGNVPILGFDFNIYHNNAEGVRELVQSSHVDVTDQSQNRVTFLKNGYSAANPMVFTGEYSARRIGGLFDMINGDEWNITRRDLNGVNGTSNGSIFVNVPALMPEGTHTYTMIFAVPIDWANKTEITCEIDQIYVPQYVADVFALSDATGTNSEDLSAMPVLAVSGSDNNEAALTAGGEAIANVSVAGTLNGFSGTDSNFLTAATDSIMDENGKEMIYTFTPTDWDAEFNVVNLSLKCRVFESNSEDYVTITVYQDGQTDNLAPRGVTLKSWVDDDIFPNYVFTFSKHHEDGQCAYSITIPVRTLTGGKNGNRLTIGVADTAEGNEEMSEIDDTCVLLLNNSLSILRQPEDNTVLSGEDAVFTVEANGGSAPYKYCWQKIENGNWVNIKNATSASLTIKNTSAQMNGMIVRCVITDSENNSISSDSAELTVKDGSPDTGDKNDFVLWLIALALLSVGTIICIILLQTRKKGN